MSNDPRMKPEKPAMNIHESLRKTPPNQVLIGVSWQLPPTLRIASEILLLFHMMYRLVVAAETEGEKLSTMLSIKFLMLQVRSCNDQVSPPKHIRFRCCQTTTLQQKK